MQAGRASVVKVYAFKLLQVFDIPFNSANKWSLAVTSCPGDNASQVVMMKGAPEIVLTKCSHHLQNKQEKEIDDVSNSMPHAANMATMLVHGSGSRIKHRRLWAQQGSTRRDKSPVCCRTCSWFIRCWCFVIVCRTSGQT